MDAAEDRFCLMPSEIARLVYGYCIDIGCDKTAQMLLEESSYLKEFAQGLKNGFRYTTKINNKSLIQLLNGEIFSRKNISQQNNQIDFQNIVTNLTDYLNDSFIVKVENMISKISKSLEEKLSNLPEVDKNCLFTPRNKKHFIRTNTPNQYSPRRKNATPRRFLNSSFHSQPDLSENFVSYSENNLFYSSPIFTSACRESEVPSNIVQPQAVIGEFLKFTHSHMDELVNSRLVQAANVFFKEHEKKFQSFTGEMSVESKPHSIVIKETVDQPKLTPMECENEALKIGNIEKDLLPQETLDELIDSLTKQPMITDFIQGIVEKEIQNTPFKNFQPVTPNSNTSVSSLNTPNVLSTPYEILENSFKSSSNQSVIPVKNLMKELSTPQKRNFAQQSNKSHLISSEIDGSSIKNQNINVVESSGNSSLSFHQPSSHHNETINISNSCIEVCPQNSLNSSSNSSNNSSSHNKNDYSKIKPVFQNQHLTRKLKKNLDSIKNKQKEVQKAFRYTSNDSKSTNSTLNADNINKSADIDAKQLTTTIELIDNKSIENLQTEQLSNDQASIIQNSVDLSSISDWPSTISQSFYIPNDQISWNHSSTDAPLFQYYYPAPQTGSIIYLNSGNNLLPTALSQEIIVPPISSKTCNASADNVDISCVSNNFPNHNVGASEKVLSNVNHQSNQKDSNMINSEKPEKTYQRPMPAILNREKLKNPSKLNNQMIETAKPNSSLPIIETDKCSSKSPKKANTQKEENRLRRKNCPMSVHPNEKNVNISNKKKKTEQESLNALQQQPQFSKNRSSYSTNDKKIKTLLDSDLDKFLDNIHRGEKIKEK